MKTTKHATLKNIAKQINDSFDAANKLAKQARDRAFEAIAEALLCGQLLNQAKQVVGHGLWLKWLDEHCPNITRQTACNYMRLANVKHVLHLENCSGLRQAYIACGILPKPEHNETLIGMQPTYLLVLNRFSSVRSQMEKLPLNQWPDDARDKLREQLKPIVRELFGELLIPPARNLF